MRNLVLAILAGVTVSMAGPAAAQTYASGYPVCLHVWGPTNLRMPLYVASSVQRVGIRTRGAVYDQSIFRQRPSAGGASLPAVSPDLLSYCSSTT
jgi:hypothetical protein